MSDPNDLDKALKRLKQRIEHTPGEKGVASVAMVVVHTDGSMNYDLGQSKPSDLIWAFEMIKHTRLLAPPTAVIADLENGESKWVNTRS